MANETTQTPDNATQSASGATQTDKPATTQTDNVSMSRDDLNALIKDASKASADDVEKRIKSAQLEVANAQIVAQRAASLLPNGFDATGKSVRDILVQAVGKSVDDVGDKSDDYLQGALHILVKHRATPTEQSATRNEFTPTRFDQILQRKRARKE